MLQKKVNCIRIVSGLLLIVTISWIGAFNANATNYFFSAKGKDSNLGTDSLVPFQNLTKIASLSIQPGDTLFFKRGNTFYGQVDIFRSGLANKPIVCEAYGKGANPVISGIKPIKTWTAYTSSIYVASVPAYITTINQLFVNGKRMTLARYPNKGFLPIDSSNNHVTVTNKSLIQQDGYWNGTNIIARTERWTYENKKIMFFKNKTVYLASPTDYTLKKGFGFFLNNSLSALDSTGEWYFDFAQKKLYLIAPGTINPNTLSIEVSATNYGLNLANQRFITVRNLTLIGQNLDGIYVGNSAYITMTNCSFIQNFRNGITDDEKAGHHFSILQCYFNDIGNNGIDLFPSSFSTIKGNTLTKIALRPDMGGSGDGNYIGIFAPKNSYIGYNTLDSIGYNGIHGYSNDTIEFNYIQNVCITKDDGAAIYVYKSNHVVINKNIVRNSIGNGNATPDLKITNAHGIYVDDSSSYCTIQENTLINADIGIFLHNTFSCTVKKNISYNNRSYQFALQHDFHVLKTVAVTGNTIQENIFHCLSPHQFCIYIWTYRNSLSYLGNFDTNYYLSPYMAECIKTVTVPAYPNNTLQHVRICDYAQWKKDFPSETRTHIFHSPEAYYKVLSTETNLLVNSTFTTGIQGWYAWGNSNYTINLDSANVQLPGKLLKSTFTNSIPFAVGNFASGNFNTISDHYYLLSLKANSSKAATLNFSISQNAYPYLVDQETTAGFALGKAAKKINYIFKSGSNFTNARVLFSCTTFDSALWVDDVQLQKITVDTSISQPKTNYRLFINPTTAYKKILFAETYLDVNGVVVPAEITLPPFGSMVTRKVINNQLLPSLPAPKQLKSARKKIQ